MATNDDEQAHDSGQATPLSEARLAEIRERVDATTPGPWELEIGVTHDEFVHYSIRTHDPLPAHPWSPRYIAWLTGGQDSMNGDRPPIKVCDACGMVAYRYRHLQRQVDFRVDEETAADAAFIAHARADIPALLDEVERLRTQIDRQAASFVEQRGKLYETMDNLAEAQEKARFYGERVDAYMRENIQRKAREAVLLAVVQAVAEAGVGAEYSAGTWLMFAGYDAETVREQARALLASAEGDAGEQAAQGEEGRL